MVKRLAVAGLLVFLGCPIALATDAERSQYVPCDQDPARQQHRAEELKRLVDADQADRADWQHLTPDQWQRVMIRDRSRRERVGRIFGEGCLKTAADYAAAALIYQHGDQPDHFFQTFVWSMRGVEQGDQSQRDMEALGIDRYLVSIGKKQLFASQASEPGEGACWCLEQVESTFPDAMRLQYVHRSLAEALAWVDTLNVGMACGAARQCDKPLLPTPAGSVPGLW